MMIVHVPESIPLSALERFAAEQGFAIKARIEQGRVELRFQYVPEYVRKRERSLVDFYGRSVAEVNERLIDRHIA